MRKKQNNLKSNRRTIRSFIDNKFFSLIESSVMNVENSFGSLDERNKRQRRRKYSKLFQIKKISSNIESNKKVEIDKLDYKLDCKSKNDINKMNLTNKSENEINETNFEELNKEIDKFMNDILLINDQDEFISKEIKGNLLFPLNENVIIENMIEKELDENICFYLFNLQHSLDISSLNEEIEEIEENEENEEKVITGIDKLEFQLEALKVMSNFKKQFEKVSD
jgi:hypothetical protein